MGPAAESPVEKATLSLDKSLANGAKRTTAMGDFHSGESPEAI